MAEHNTLTGASLHEPKGVAAAGADKVYHANGSGSGSWEFQEYTLHGKIADVSTAASSYLLSPYAGTIEKIYSIIDGALGTADATLSFEIAGTPITSGDITITQASSAAGDVDSSTPSAANTVSAGQAIELITDGLSTNAVAADIVMVLKRTV